MFVTELEFKLTTQFSNNADDIMATYSANRPDYDTYYIMN